MGRRKMRRSRYAPLDGSKKSLARSNWMHAFRPMDGSRLCSFVTNGDATRQGSQRPNLASIPAGHGIGRGPSVLLTMRIYAPTHGRVEAWARAARLCCERCELERLHTCAYRTL